MGDDKKEGFFKYINGNRQYKNNISPLQDEDGLLTSRERDKAEVFKAFFASIFNMDDSPRESQCPELDNYD